MANIHAPNKSFSGVRYGVTFTNGIGQSDDKTVLAWFKTNGYQLGDAKPATAPASVGTVAGEVAPAAAAMPSDPAAGEAAPIPETLAAGEPAPKAAAKTAAKRTAAK